MGEDRPRPYLRLVENLQQSIAELDDAPCEGPPTTTEKPAEVIDFDVARASSGTLEASQVTPETVLKLALRDVEAWGNVAKCYITLILDDGEAFTTCNYRADLSRVEEVAFRQLGLAEAIESWRGKGGE